MMITWKVARRSNKEGFHLRCLLNNAGDCVHLGGVDLSRGGEVFLCCCFVDFLRAGIKRINCSAEGIDIFLGACHISNEFRQVSCSRLDQIFDIHINIFGRILTFTVFS